MTFKLPEKRAFFKLENIFFPYVELDKVRYSVSLEPC